MQTDQYLNIQSHHSVAHKWAAVRTLMYRKQSLSSLTVSRVEKDNGYHMYKRRFIQKQACPSVKQNGKTRATLILYIYISGLSELIIEAWHISL